MKILVKTKPSAKQEQVECLKQASLAFSNFLDNLAVYKVSVKEPPVGGRANAAIIKVLAKYFKVSPASVNLISGHTSKQKVFEISED